MEYNINCFNSVPNHLFNHWLTLIGQLKFTSDTWKLIFFAVPWIIWCGDDHIDCRFCTLLIAGMKKASVDCSICLTDFPLLCRIFHHASKSRLSTGTFCHISWVLFQLVTFAGLLNSTPFLIKRPVSISIRTWNGTLVFNNTWPKSPT